MFAREKVKGYKRRGQIGTFRSHRTTCRKFTAFIEDNYGREEVPFEALEAELFRGFRTYCYEERGNSTNTVGRELPVLRTLVQHAVKAGITIKYFAESPITVCWMKRMIAPTRPQNIAETSDCKCLTCSILR